MLITHYAIFKLQRDENRQWTIVGQCNDLPGECRPGRIYPIVAMWDPETGVTHRIRRTYASGWIDPEEKYGYVKMNFWTRRISCEVEAVDTVTVTVQGLQ